MPRGIVTPEAAALRDRLMDQLFNVAATLSIDDTELAKRMGIRKATINDYRAGRSKPRAIAKLQRVVTELAVEPYHHPQQPTHPLTPPAPTPKAPRPTRHWTPKTKARKTRLVNTLRAELSRTNITPIEAMRLAGVSTKNSAIYAWLNGASLPHDNSIIPMIKRLQAIPTPAQLLPQPPAPKPTQKPNGPVPTPTEQPRPQVVVGLIRAISKLKLDDQVALLQLLES